MTKSVDRSEARAAAELATKDTDVRRKKSTLSTTDAAGPVDEVVAEAKTKETPVETTLAVAAPTPTIASSLSNVINAVGTWSSTCWPWRPIWEPDPRLSRPAARSQ